MDKNKSANKQNLLRAAKELSKRKHTDKVLQTLRLIFKSGVNDPANRN